MEEMGERGDGFWIGNGNGNGNGEVRGWGWGLELCVRKGLGGLWKVNNSWRIIGFYLVWMSLNKICIIYEILF